MKILNVLAKASITVAGTILLVALMIIVFLLGVTELLVRSVS